LKIAGAYIIVKSVRPLLHGAHSQKPIASLE